MSYRIVDWGNQYFWISNDIVNFGGENNLPRILIKPHLLICNVNPIRGTRIFLMTNGSKIYDIISDSIISQTSYRKGIQKVLKKSMINEKLLAECSHKMDDMLKECKINGKNCPKQAFQTTWFNSQICHRFNINSSISKISWILDPEEFDYIIPNKGFVGFRLMLLDSISDNIPSYDSIMAGPFYQTNVKIKLRKNNTAHHNDKCKRNYLDISNFTLTTVGLKIFENQNLMKIFSLDIECLKEFLHSVEEIYHCFNPYHNALHSADVAQAMHCFLLDQRIKIISEPIDVLSAIIAAFCHDADHPGLNQIHLEKTNHFFVTFYNHSSILENHHYRVTMSLLQQTSLLKNLSQENWRTLSSSIYNMIMATDITHQKSYLNKFMNFLHDKKLNSFNSTIYTKDEKMLVYQLALKCADISNPSRCWPITLGWASLVCEEFFLQGDMEKTQGLSVMSTHDRCMTTKADIQLGFIRFIVRPLLTQWNVFLKSMLSNLLIKYVDINLNKWEIYKQKFSAVSTKIVHNPATKIDLNVVNCSTTTSVSPLSGLATLTEETTLVSSCTTKISADVHRRLSLPDNVFNSLNKPQKPKHRLSTTMITFARPSPSSQILSCRRGSLPQHIRASSVSNPSRRRGSLPLMVKAFPIPSAWEESNSINTKKCSTGPRTSQNTATYVQHRRGSAPLIGCPITNQDWKGNGFSGMSSCLKEQLLLEVYWMNASSSVSSTNSVNAGSTTNIPPLYLSSSSGSSRNDSATGTVTIR